jgi:DNA-binding transcriptional LysR family regulator
VEEIRVELRHLRYFVAVAEEMSFGGAARRLKMSQPPLSQQVKDLEREIGVELVDRSRRKIRLTHAGRLFLEEARRTLEQAERSVQTAVRADRGEIGKLSVGFLGSATYDVLPRVLRGFRRVHPDVQFALETMSTAQQVEAFRDGRIQVGFLRPPLEEDTLSVRVLAREPLVAVLPADHPLAARQRVPLGDLSKEDFVLWPRAAAPRIRDEMVGYCREAGFSPKVVQESTELQTVLGLVASGMGASLLIGSPEHIPRHPGVVYRAITSPEAAFDLALAWREDERYPIVSAFVETARSFAASSGRDDLSEQAG